MIDLSHRRISPKEVAAMGWERISGMRSFVHPSGWKIMHCGHPTALWPYILLNPEGDMILTGAAACGRSDFGTAWPSVASAMDYVKTLTR